MKRYLLILFLFADLVVKAQSVEEYFYRNPQDSSYNCYLTVKPENGKIKGLVVRDYSRLPEPNSKSPFRLTDLLVANNIMVLYTTTSNYFPELYYDFEGAEMLDDIIHEVVSKYKIPIENIIIGGMSSSGTRAARYTQYCLEGRSKYKHQPKALFMVDSPLDMERFYLSAANHMSYFTDGMLEEAEWMVRVFPKKLKSTPGENPDPYRKNSAFSHNLPLGGNAQYFDKLPILIFHEPDIDWWIQERGASYYDINSYDLAAFVNTLKKMGNEQVELITTTGKGFDRDGNRKPHSWTIVDEDYLAQWIINLIGS